MDERLPIDPDVTPETRALHRSLQALEGRHTLFGHQDDLAYGIEWWAEPGRSDVREVTGAYPAVLGFDVGHIERGADRNLDGVRFDHMKTWIREARAMGAVVTVSWHADDLVGGGSSWTQAETIRHLLPGGSHEPALIGALDRLADFLADLTDEEGRPIPIVFRPWHEHTGDWFWWGKGFNSEDDFIALWRYTIDHLRDERGLHHLLYAISPDRSRIDLDDLAGGYLYGYPGDDYVDVLGIDDYWDLGHEMNDAPLEEQHAALVATLETVATLAADRGKLAALTEAGTVRTMPDPWTGHLLTALTASERTRRILWTLVWRNPPGRPGEAFAPHAESPTADDLAAFKADPFVLFADGLPDLYAG